jgi:hypothetical protein
MQTNTRNIRTILAKAYGGKITDQKHCDVADLIYKELTGKENPKRDPVAGWLGMSQAEETRMHEITEILHDFEREFRRADDLAGSAIWQDFARMFVRKERDLGHHYKTWLNWFTHDPKRMEWAWKETPQSIKARWLMAWDSDDGKIKNSNIPAGV